MTNGQPLRVRAAMKPISTVPRALATIDMATGEEAVAIHQRSDVRRAAAGVVAEAMVALVVARAVLEKFGGDSSARLVATSTATCTPSRSCAGFRSDAGLRVTAMAPSRAGRIAGLREIHHRTSARAGDGFDPARHGQCDRGEDRPGDRRDLRRGRRRGVPPDRRRGDPRRWRPTTGFCRLGRRRHVTGVREALAGHTVVFLEISASEGAQDQWQHGSSLAGGRRSCREISQADERPDPAVPQGRDHPGEHQSA